jgi:hypothetical protein
VQQGGLGSALGLGVPALAFGCGGDDPPVRIALEVDLALAAGEGTGGELFDEAFRV